TGQVAQQRRRIGVAVERCGGGDVTGVDARGEGAPMREACGGGHGRKSMAKWRRPPADGTRSPNHPVGWGRFAVTVRTTHRRSSMGVVHYERTLFEPEH